MRLVLLLAILGLRSLLTKAVALGLVMLLFWAKGRRFRFRQDCWEAFLRDLSWGAVQRYVAAVYLTAAAASAASCWGLLRLTGFRRSAEIAAAVLAAGLALTAAQWFGKGRSLLQRKYQALQRQTRAEPGDAW